MNRPQRTRTMPSRFSEDFTLTNDLTSLETTQDDEVNDSAHLLKHQDADSELGSDHEMEQGSDEEVEVSRKKKKAKKSSTASKKTTTKSKKKSQLFVNTPLDIMMEIASYVDTPTLLALSRTCSAMRQLTHGPHGAAMWQQSRLNFFGMPDLTAPLPEWEYASLACDKICHGCKSKTRATSVDFDVRVRVCATCKKERLVRISYSSPYHRETSSCVPRSSNRYWSRELDTVSSQLKQLEVAPASIQPHPYSVYITQRKALVSAVQSDAQALTPWHKTVEVAQDNELAAIRARRKAALEVKMKELGYDDNDFEDEAWKNNSLVKRAHELSDSIWKTARPKLIQCLDPIRARNLQLQAEGRREARRRSLRPYYDELRGSLDHSSITYLAFPSFDEWCKFTLVRDVWTPGDGKVVEQVKIDEAKDAILAHCLGLNPALKASIAQHLGGLPARTPSIYSYTSSASELASLYTYHSDANLTDLEWVILNLPVDFERCSSTSCGIKRLLAVVLEELATNPSAIRPNLITEARFTSAVRELQIVKSILNKLGWNGVSDPVQCMENRGQGFRCSGCDQRGARGGLSHWEWHPFVGHVYEKHSGPGADPAPLLYTAPAYVPKRRFHNYRRRDWYGGYGSSDEDDYYDRW